MAKLLQSLRDEMVRRDYAAPPFAAAASSRARTAAIARFPSVLLLAALLPMDATEDRSLFLRRVTVGEHTRRSRAR